MTHHEPQQLRCPRPACRRRRERYDIFRLDRVPTAHRLPYSLKVLLENLLRNEDGQLVTGEQVRGAGRVGPGRRASGAEIAFTPARVLMQDFTGVPCVVDLVAMRDAMTALGGDPARINPLIPTELVIDHSVIADVFGRPDAFARQRRAGVQPQRASATSCCGGRSRPSTTSVVVPPGHRHLPPGQPRVPGPGGVHPRRPDGAAAYPDTLVGTDSHTPMVNGLGVLGWGVGGIEAEAAMLGQPMSMLIPQVLGIKLTGELPRGHHRHRPGAHRRGAAAPHRGGRQVRRVLRPRRGERAAGEPGHHRQHEPRIRVDLRDLPDR